VNHAVVLHYIATDFIIIMWSSCSNINKSSDKSWSDHMISEKLVLCTCLGILKSDVVIFTPIFNKNSCGIIEAFQSILFLSFTNPFSPPPRAWTTLYTWGVCQTILFTHKKKGIVQTALKWIKKEGWKTQRVYQERKREKKTP